MRYNGIICIFGPKKGHFRQLGPYNCLLSSQTATFQKTEGIQSYLRICGCYDLIELSSFEPQKKGCYGCSVKNHISGLLSNMKMSFRCLVMMVTILSTKKLISGPKTAFFGPKRATLSNRCRKTARVTTGYGGLMIGPVRLTRKNGGFISVA